MAATTAEQLLTALGDAAYTYDPTQDRLAWQGDLSLVGSPAPQTLQHWLERIHPADRGTVRARFEAPSPRTATLDYRVAHSNSRFVWCNDRSAVVEQDGTPTIAGFLRDGMLGRRRHEQDERTTVESNRRLRQLQGRLERAIVGASDGMWEYDPTTEEFWVSDSLMHLLGIPPTERDQLPATASSFVDLLHPADRQATFNAIQRHLVSGETYDAQYRLRLRSGEYRWFRARGNSQRDAAGHPLRMSGSVRDVEEERTAQSRLELATRAARIGLWDCDVSSGHIYFNDTLCTILGYAPGELPMDMPTWVGLVHPDDLEQSWADLQRHCNGETETYANEHRLRKKDGTYLWVQDVGEVTERTDEGLPKRIIGVHIDIQAMRDARERAEAASQAKSAFLANMSHEIRTPMTAILGFADLLGAGSTLSDPNRAQDAVQIIRTNANHLLSIINDILDVSKIEAGQMHTERIDTNPVRVAQQVAKLSTASAQAKGLTLSVHYRTDIPRSIQSDPTRLKQILLNLLQNAIKFTAEGTVTLTLSFEPDQQLLCAEVADTGVGMTEEELDAIRRFETFRQADSSTTRRYGGSGLGLHICNALTTLLGGSLTIASEYGVGSQFTASVATGPVDPASLLPLGRTQRGAPSTDRASPATNGPPTQPTPAPVRAPAPVAEGPLAGRRILLAEDGVDNQRLISYLLSQAGAEVTLASNGRVAIELATETPPEAAPHVILMDMQMPELDGYTATRRLRAQGYRGPIVAVTAHAMEGDREKCLEAGCDDYLTKPVDTEALIATCARFANMAVDTPLAT